MDNEHITWHQCAIPRGMREQQLKQKGMTLWFTGLSGAGKSTTAFTLEHLLVQAGFFAYVLDGDNVRHGLNSDLGFSATDRNENIRRVGEVARLFADTGVITIVSFISPYHSERRKVRAAHEQAGLPFLEVFLDTPLNVCEKRDPKGLYKLAREGKLDNFTGVDAPYERPESAEIIINPSILSPKECAEEIIVNLSTRQLLQTEILEHEHVNKTTR